MRVITSYATLCIFRTMWHDTCTAGTAAATAQVYGLQHIAMLGCQACTISSSQRNVNLTGIYTPLTMHALSIPDDVM